MSKNFRSRGTAEAISVVPSVLLYLACALFAQSCGVKGKPQPPLMDSPIGRGRPSFIKAINDQEENAKSLQQKQKRGEEAEERFEE